MIEKRQKEIKELEENAMQILDNPELLPKDSAFNFWNPILRLWVYPSFETYKVWVFYEANYQTIKLTDISIREITWDRLADLERLMNPLEGLKKGFDTKPQIESKSVKIEAESFKDIFNSLQNIDFPAFANYKRNIGVDGVYYGIETIDFTHNTTVSWWSVYPKEWEKLIEWFEKVTNFLEETFAEH